MIGGGERRSNELIFRTAGGSTDIPGLSLIQALQDVSMAVTAIGGNITPPDRARQILHFHTSTESLVDVGITRNNVLDAIDIHFGSTTVARC
ncbi:MAG: hypothetical protein K2W95_14935 [Candidatus Obscuribacterales bacterium]|nr:hypothetical protein [Candidatus Obscuribacterales bacterium]